MSFKLQYGKNGIWYGIFSTFPEAIVTHAISTRFGGTSNRPFHSMNLAMHNGDEITDVIKNRQLFCQALGVDNTKLITAEQIHSDSILYVDENMTGRGAFSYNDAIKKTDALITDVKGLPLMLFFADCVPVLFVDEEHQAIGISHAGWRGTVKKIASQTAVAMQNRFGTDLKKLRVGIGPSIGDCCYEVDDFVFNQFKPGFASYMDELFISHGEKWLLDLWKANKLQLIETGVAAENIDCAEVCTNCNHELFFSYRADSGMTGRIGALISLK